MNPKNCIVLLVTFIMISCYIAPRSVYLLEPEQDTGVWLMGKQYFHAQTDDFKVALAFDQMDYYEYQFHVEVTNKSNKAILVAPENFSMVAYVSSLSQASYDTVLAIDPEQQILETHKNKSWEYAAYETEVGNQTLFSFLDLVSDIASIDDSHTNEETLEEENEDLEREVDELQTELDHEREVKSLNNYMSKWESKALRKTTMPHGFLIRGEIYFPFITRAQKLELHVNLLGEDIVFKYEQFEEKVK